MKKVVIVGASSGIGRQLALNFANRGWRVGIAARREEPLRKIHEEFPESVVYETLDVTVPDATGRFYHLIEQTGGMDLMIYCAGAGFQDPELSESVTARILAVNCDGFARMLNAGYKYYRDTANLKPGRIAVVTSIAGTRGIGAAAAYSASKRFQWTYIDALDQLAHTQHVNVKFTDIRPGFVRTPLLSEDGNYPMMMSVERASRLIERAIAHGRRRSVIDARWRVVGWLWRLIPRVVWNHIDLVGRTRKNND